MLARAAVYGSTDRRRRFWRRLRPFLKQIGEARINRIMPALYSCIDSFRHYAKKEVKQDDHYNTHITCSGMMRTIKKIRQDSNEVCGRLTWTKTRRVYMP